MNQPVICGCFVRLLILDLLGGMPNGIQVQMSELLEPQGTFQIKFVLVIYKCICVALCSS